MTVPVQTAEPTPCPFCGSVDISDGEVLAEDREGHCTKQSECLSCHALGPAAALEPGEIDYGDIKAIAAWNRRAALREGAVQPAEASPEPVAEVRVRNDKMYIATLNEAILEPGMKLYAAVPAASGQGPAGSSPTGAAWISVDERMPEERTGVLVAGEFDGPGDWRMKWASRVPGHPDAVNGWLMPGGSWTPSHWMPLPEAPVESSPKAPDCDTKATVEMNGEQP